MTGVGDVYELDGHTLDPRERTLRRGTADVRLRRRAFDVLTRARQRLELLRCKHRVMRGKPVPRTPCRFLPDIPEDLLETFEVKDASPLSMAEMAASANNLLAMLDAIGK